MAGREFELPPAHPRARGATRRTYGTNEHSLKEQEQLLQNYTFLDRSKWGTLQTGDAIRYVKTDGNFCKGGVINTTRFMGKGPHEGRECMSMRSNSGVHCPHWVVAWDTIQEIYIGPPAALLLMKDGIESNIVTIDANIRKLVDVLQKLQRQVTALEHDVALLKTHQKV